MSDNTPTYGSRLCSDHFITGMIIMIIAHVVVILHIVHVGKPSKIQSHPDYVPSLFSYQAKAAKPNGSIACFTRASNRHKHRRACDQQEGCSSDEPVLDSITSGQDQPYACTQLPLVDEATLAQDTDHEICALHVSECSTISLRDISLYLYGHLTSKRPEPQQSHEIMLSGEAPKYGY